MMDIKKRILEGDRLALAKLITMAENNRPEATEVIKEMYYRTGNAYLIGITGLPGAGKSTLTAKLAKAYSKMGKKIGIVACDPTSPYTGGAILGDRIRMQELFTDPNIFIRSMGSRGHLGGLSKGTRAAIRAMDIFGMDYIFIETVGVGQSEVEIAGTADTTVMVLAPGLGDDIQAMKAGIMEIGDIFVVNKADREGAEKTSREIEAMLDLNERSSWRPRVILTVAQDNKGIEDVLYAIDEHMRYLKDSGIFDNKRRENIKNELLELLTQNIMAEIMSGLSKEDLMGIVDKVAKRELDPYSASTDIIKQTRIGGCR
ncbi:methylmalonyl Co-A mutase-associated GTPase MeaB [Calorimonas adulescens]|uniref:Methylmalonyl Co-A mutase-associated GTPase MeaB n=2 Tax=Calorimonas adulescens TaxID=2606906 RepID=A0A5D8QB10_9THEO|nr:methylmalonyl Co-A mutase-associated GTPase MeaB [Calorimonas adulescens]